MPVWAPTQLPFLHVRNYGAVGDGSTDDTTALQNALNALAAGQILQFEPGKPYKITSGLTCSTANIELRGGGGTGQHAAVGLGATRILVPASTIGLTYNSAAASTVFQGPVIRGLTFVDNSGNNTATGGLLIKRTNNFRVVDCAAASFGGGYGFYFDGTGNNCQYAVIDRCGAYNNQIGFKQGVCNGIRYRDCHIDANSNTVSSVASGTTGIQHITSGDTISIGGCIIQGTAIGVDLQAGQGHAILGTRFEGFTTGLKLTGVTQSQFYGLQMNNSAQGGAGTGISADNASNHCTFFAAFQSVTTPSSLGSGAAMNLTTV